MRTKDVQVYIAACEGSAVLWDASHACGCLRMHSPDVQATRIMGRSNAQNKTSDISVTRRRTLVWGCWHGRQKKPDRESTRHDQQVRCSR